jgi:predicted XRE-type DNA-binding protein
MHALAGRYSFGYYSSVTNRGELLGQVMRQTCVSQSELSRLSGVHQPSISQFLSGKIDMSDEQLDRLLSCLGYHLEVTRRAVPVELTRSERRSWQLHRHLSRQLDRPTLERWHPTLRKNLKRLRGGVQGQPHERNLRRWTSLVDSGDLGGLHRVLTGLDRDSIEMREVSPFGGLLASDERNDILQPAR